MCLIFALNADSHLIINRERSPKRPEEVVADSDYHDFIERQLFGLTCQNPGKLLDTGCANP